MSEHPSVKNLKIEVPMLAWSTSTPFVLMHFELWKRRIPICNVLWNSLPFFKNSPAKSLDCFFLETFPSFLCVADCTFRLWAKHWYRPFGNIRRFFICLYFWHKNFLYERENSTRHFLFIIHQRTYEISYCFLWPTHLRYENFFRCYGKVIFFPVRLKQMYIHCR